MKRWLLSLYPRAWLDQYGDEYAAFLEDTDVSFADVWDIFKTAFVLHMRMHKKVLYISLCIMLVMMSSLACMRLGLTANVLIWSPTNPYRALGLATTVAPVVYIAYYWPKPLYELQRSSHSKVTWIVIAMLNLASTILLIFLSTFFITFTGIAKYIAGGQFSLPTIMLTSLHAVLVQVVYLFILLAVGSSVIKGVIEIEKYLLRRSSFLVH